MNTWEVILSGVAGIALSAACGFRVFVPLLIMSIAAHAGHLQPAPGFGWIGSTPALVAFSVATAVEITAYYVPWLDHLLDTITTPAAGIAGVLVAAACISGMSPFLRWAIAVIAGGGVALTVQIGTVLLRLASLGTTGGFGNPIVATAEAILSTAVSVLAILVPIVAAFMLLGVPAAIIWLIVRRLRRRRLSSLAPGPAA